MAETTLQCILNYSDPRTVSHAHGAYIWIDGKRYIDTSMGNSVHILGHRQTIEINGGTLYGLAFQNIYKYVDLLKRYTGFDRFVFCNTGSEATMRAARIARAYTGKHKIDIFEGSWHGTCDTYLTTLGIPDNKNLVILPYEDKSSEIIAKSSDIAMVFIDPVQGCLPQDNSWFLRALREVTKDKGILLGFDEVITGFRVARGGCKELFGIEPDIITYGKIAGGGFPIGIVAGNTQVMDTVKKDVTLGGTFFANPVSINQGYIDLSQLNEDVYKQLNNIGERFRKEVKIPTVGVGSFNRFIFNDRKLKKRAERDKYEDQNWKQETYRKLYEKGIYIGHNGIQFFSIEHTPEIITQIIDTVNSI